VLIRFLARIALIALPIFTTACGGSLVSNPQPQQQSAFPSPVAFVTAEQPPAQAPTPTQPSLPTPTVAPATPVPKREPQASTLAIGLWSSNISDPTYPGFLDIAGGGGASALRQQKNQLMLLIDTQQVQTGFATNVSDTAKASPDFFLYDSKKALVRAANTEPLLNIRNEEVRKRLAEGVVQRAQNVDMLIVSNVGDELIRTTNAPIFTGTKVFTDQQRRDAAEGLLRSLRARVTDRLLVVGGYAWRDGVAYAARTSEAQELSAIVDGVHIEQFVRSPISATNAFKSEANWKRDVDMLAELSKDNRIVLLTTRLDSEDAGDELARQWLNYSVASYLLGKSGAYTYFEFDTGTPNFANESVLSAPVGAPTEPYAKRDSGLYVRRFERGIVIVNPSGDSKKTEIESGYRTLSGTAVEQSVTLSPRTGLILIK
jgi:hypothetical protein